MREFALGSSLPRIEDPQLLRGQGRYTDDISLPGQVHLYVLRSVHAAALIRGIDIAAARSAPGIVAVATGADLLADAVGSLPARVRRKRADGAPSFHPPYRALATERVAMVGDPVCAIFAETLAAAKDAAERVAIDYAPLPSVTDVAAAVAPGAPAVWPQCADNICFREDVGDRAAVDAAFAIARHVVRQRLVISRVAVNSMEPRMALGAWDAREARYTLYSGMQAPHLTRADLAEFVFKEPASAFRCVSPDVGGGFGMKGGLYPEQVIVLWAARKLGRPVKWTGERGDAFISDFQARDNVSDVALALDAAGRFLALRVETLASLGAYVSTNGAGVPLNNIGGLAGTYTTPAIHVGVTGVYTNASPTGPYRGAGRPEASYCIERIIDIAAAEIGIDRIELRRRNMIPPSAMPFKTGLVYTYDCGAFAQTMDMTLELADWKGAQRRRARARAAGRLYGLGVASVIEIAGGPFPRPFEEGAEVRFEPTGSATILVGSHSHGQGHETSLRQIAFHALGLRPHEVRLVCGDTDQVFHGRGTFGSRTMASGGAALMRAAQRVIEKGKHIAAHVLEADAGDIAFAGGRFSVAGTDRGIDLVEVARISYQPQRMVRDMEPGLQANAIVIPDGANFPNGCHVCEVDIDPETGIAAILRYAVVDDVGVTVNPMLLKGQVHGGIAMGAGQAMGEVVRYDADNGQPVTASFMDYWMPRADDFPALIVGSNDVPTRNNPLGVKGAGEAGAVGALPAVLNAVNDALSPLGIRHFEMPASPERLWRAIAQAPARRR
ncbi:MAG: xanthine dehydrogenase family protein [Proteobacteria bacterium]|nr:xanthine dehydrogenase family protein [Pseudomonadota bacterium]